MHQWRGEMTETNCFPHVGWVVLVVVTRLVVDAESALRVLPKAKAAPLHRCTG